MNLLYDNQYFEGGSSELRSMTETGQKSRRTNRRQMLRESGAITATVVSLGLSGCSGDEEGDRAFVHIQNHGQEQNMFFVEIDNEEDEDADLTIILKLLDESETTLARLERQETVGSNSTRRFEFEIQEEDLDGDLEDVETYEFELEGELVE